MTAGLKLQFLKGVSLCDCSMLSVRDTFWFR